MFLSLYNQKIKVYLADSTGDVQGVRANLGTVLQKAGMEVVYPSANSDEAREQMRQCNCSVHVLGAVDIYSEAGQDPESATYLHYQWARAIDAEGFRVFLWNPSGLINSRNMYVNSLRRDIVENTIYSGSTSPIVFVEELRGIMSVAPTAKSSMTNADIFFIYNDLDRETASDVLQMLQDIQKVASLSVNMSSNTDYSEYIGSQMKVCRICVIYCDYAMDWAMPFARQIWKDSGGMSAGTSLFMAINSQHANTENLGQLTDFMEYTVTEKSLLPLDIKIFFDKVTQQK